MGIVTFTSCKDNPPYPMPEQILDEDTYLTIFYELELLRIYQNQGIPSSKIDSLYFAVFDKYGVESALFDSTHQYFQTQPDEQQARTDTVLNWLQQGLDEITRLDSLLMAQDSLTSE